MMVDKTKRTWIDMLHRCNNKNALRFKYYGGRGIKVCDRWLVYSNFLKDMGMKPKGLSLDRIDNSKGYSKGNCRWATRSQQMRNYSKNKCINQYTKDGKLIKTFSSAIEAAEKTKTNYHSILHIINGSGGKYRKSANGYVWKLV